MARSQPTRQSTLASTGLVESELPLAEEVDGPLPRDLEFTPVPRRARNNGLTAARQRVFIRALAETGCVRVACRVIDCASRSVYRLRNSPGGESFGAAWDKAIARAVPRILDVMMDHAINGTPELVYKDGQLIGERRHFNTRAQMWIVAHNMPEKYGVTGGLMHNSSGPIGLKWMKDQWRREWAEELRASQPDPEAAYLSIAKKINAIRSGFKRTIADDPAKRAAWDLLTGPTDWSDFDRVTDYGWNPPDTNQNRPDMVVLNAMGMDALYGKREGGNHDES